MTRFPRLLGLLLLLSLGLILCKQAGYGPPARWGWWAVTAPVWGPWLALLALVLGLLVVRTIKGARA